MTFSSIMMKNFKFNFKKYIAYYLANSFIICVLLMYGSLIYSKDFVEASETNALKGNFFPILVLMVAFSVVFICYTTTSFIRYRGREFGTYLTLGVTTKDLSKMLILENILIVAASLLTGMLVGTLFSRIFYMIIGRILHIEDFKPTFNIKMYVACTIIALTIFLFNSLFQMMFVRKLSIIDLIKSSSTTDIGKERIITGTMALGMLLTALCLFPKVIRHEIFKDYTNKAFMGIIITALVTPYFIIGSVMCIMDKIMKNFKKAYNNNILVLSSLQHKFISYKSVLYLVLVLAAAAMAFIGTAYSMYSSTEKDVDAKYPFDVSFIENYESNKASQDGLEDLVRKGCGEIEEYKTLECLNIRAYYSNEDGNVRMLGRNVGVICQSNYNKHMGANVTVNDGEMVEVTDSENANAGFKDCDMILDLNDMSKQKKQRAIMREKKDMKVGEFLSTMGKNSYMHVGADKKRHVSESFTNECDSLNYDRGTAFIVSDEDYKRIKDKLGEGVISYDHLIILKNHKDYESFNNISNKLKELNNGKEELSLQLETLQFKQKVLESNMKENGFILFSSLFLGMMFLTSSAVVLYFKVLTSIDEEKERVKKLIQLGMTTNEVSKVLTKELAIIFFIPAFLAVGLISYFFLEMFEIVGNGDFMLQRSLYVFAAYIVMQTVFFFITRNKYVREVV